MTSERGHGAIVYCLNSSRRADTQTGHHNGEKPNRRPLTIGEAYIKRILSSRLVSREWENRNRWGVMYKCFQKLDKELWCLVKTAQDTEKKRPCPGSRELERKALFLEWNEREPWLEKSRRER
ncbi:hypothetical protein TNCV_2935471 [Trichonephila clavipes]|nr:hypothetical protein TNCV_2935471 [Trichonephila clavipes]